MSYAADINVLILCHYHAAGQSLFHQYDMLDDLAAALRARGFSGQILEVESRSEVADEPNAAAAIATQQMKGGGWKPALDNFRVAIGSFEHSIFIFGAE